MLLQKKLIEESNGAKWPELSIKPFSAFVVSRFITNHTFIENIIEETENIQIIELGPGFSPHYLNLNKVYKYIEVDLESNSVLKKKIVNEIKPDCENLSFISGDILDKKTWQKIENEIDSDKPVLIFSEGVVSQYFNKEQKELLFSFIQNFLNIEGSIFSLDDTLRNHPEHHSNQIIKEGMKAVVEKSKSEIYNNSENYQSFSQELSFWQNLSNNSKIYTIDYILSRPDMDFAIMDFKLIIITNDPNGKYSGTIEKLSKINTQTRVWR